MDPYTLSRFVTAQEDSYHRALEEIRGGRKQSHWMWYVFPQVRGLGRSAMSETYAIGSLDEARAYLAHPVLGPRLMEIAEAVLAIEDRSATQIFGRPDDLKLQSSATLFAAASPAGSAFERILERYFDRRQDQRTLQLLSRT